MFCSLAALLLLAAQTMATPAPAAALSPFYKPGAGPWIFTIRDEQWTDARRNRVVPVRIYFPTRADDQSLRPVIIMSHGWGGSRTSYAYFNQQLASWGYLVIAPTHAGSDTASIALRPTVANTTIGPKRETLMQSIQDPDNLQNRPEDISFVIDQLSQHANLARIADTKHIGVAGHSFGAYTAMAIGGMVVDLPGQKQHSMRDPRVGAVLAMSPEGSGLMGISPNAWDHFAVPVLFLTGTRDYGRGGHPAAWRTEPFHAVRTMPAWLVTIIGGTHLTFVRPGSEQPLIQSLSVAFFDAQLLHEPKAVAWMNGFFAVNHGDCIVSHKD
jgi:predicted dienelactone hydrolase